MSTKMNISWLTINRSCNLKCNWCYAKNASINEMSLSDAKKAIDFLDSIKISHITLIGGEPSIYKDLPQLIRYAHNKKMRIGMVTNGLRLKDPYYLQELITCGINNIGLSLKGYSDNSFFDTTGVNGYKDTLQAITNISKLNIPFGVSFVLTKENMNNIDIGINDAVNAGARWIHLGFCYDFEACRTNATAFDNPFEIAALFEKNYEKINNSSKGKMLLHQTLPLCVFHKEIIDTMVERHQIRSTCQLLKRDGLIFDTDLSVIPCNAMYDYKLGKLGKDFHDSTSFDEFWNSVPIQRFFNKLISVPDVKCINCDGFKYCGGGCISNWFNYSFSSLKEMSNPNDDYIF